VTGRDGWIASLKSLALLLVSAGFLPSPPLPTPPFEGDCYSMSNLFCLSVLGHNYLFTTVSSFCSVRKCVPSKLQLMYLLQKFYANWEGVILYN